RTRITSSSSRSWAGAENIFNRSSIVDSKPRATGNQQPAERADMSTKGAATELIHAGETDRGDVVPLTTPIYETTTFVFENADEVVAYNEGRSQKYLYSRYTNPTVVAVEQKLAALDRAEAALLFSSGQGATTTILMTHARAGDEVVCSAAIYGATPHLLADLL